MVSSSFKEVPIIVHASSDQSVGSEITYNVDGDEDEDEDVKTDENPDVFVKDLKRQIASQRQVVDDLAQELRLINTMPKARRRTRRLSLQESTASEPSLNLSISSGVISNPHPTLLRSSFSRYNLTDSQFSACDSGRLSNLATAGHLDAEIQCLLRKRTLLQQENARLKSKAQRARGYPFSEEANIISYGSSETKDVWSERSRMLLLVFFPLHAVFVFVMFSSYFGFKN